MKKVAIITGRSTKDHINHFVIEKAKGKLLETDKNVSTIAYQLGFEYPQHFILVKSSKSKLE